MKKILLLAMALAFSTPAHALTFWVPYDTDITDVTVVCLDDDGYRVYFENGETANHGENTTDPAEIFARGSYEESVDHGEVRVLNRDKLNDECPRYATEIEF